MNDTLRLNDSLFSRRVKTNKRKVINPNSGFQEQLKKLEIILKDNNYILPDNLSLNNNDKNNL